MTDFLREKSIKYLNRDFQTLKRDLIKFSQAHHSGAFQDFNESSPGMAILEMQAYVGDVLSFYQDMQFMELQREHARQVENVVAMAKQLGYRPSGKRAARGVQTFFLEVPYTVQDGERVPDPAYCPILRKGAKLNGPNGSVFETLEDVYFSASIPTPNTDRPLEVTGSRFDSSNGQPTHFVLRKDVETIAGETKVDTFTITDFERFKTIELADPDVLEVISVVDSDGNEWTEVDFLAQEAVFDSTVNSDSDSSTVPYVLKLITVPRRFETDRDPVTNKTSLIFGSGDGVNFDDELLPNLADLALPLPGRRTFSNYAIDPQNFLKTRSLGLSPYNTTLTVTYRVGGGSQTNVPPGTIKSVGDAVLDFTSSGLSTSKKGDVEGSLETLNYLKTDGGAPEETISEIKANSAAFFAAQMRAVTKEDYIARVLSLPAKFGKPEKVYVKQDVINPRALDIHILAKDENDHLTQATSILTQNIRTYLGRYRMLTDGVNILQTDIINLKVDFGVVVSPKLNRTEVLAKCLEVLRQYFHVDKMQIGAPIVFSDVSSQLQNVFGVISVYKLDFKNSFGSAGTGIEYSPIRFDVQSWTQNGILYCPDNSIFEVKFPTKDIVGETK